MQGKGILELGEPCLLCRPVSGLDLAVSINDFGVKQRYCYIFMVRNA